MGSQRKISFLKRCINDVEEEREKKKKAKLKVLENSSFLAKAGWGVILAFLEVGWGWEL